MKVPYIIMVVTQQTEWRLNFQFSFDYLCSLATGSAIYLFLLTSDSQIHMYILISSYLRFLPIKLFQHWVPLCCIPMLSTNQFFPRFFLFFILEMCVSKVFESLRRQSVSWSFRLDCLLGSHYETGHGPRKRYSIWECVMELWG